MKIAILGSGNVARALGKRWAENGHEIVFGVRDPSHARVVALLKHNEKKMSASSQQEAIKEAHVILLAIPWQAVEKTLHQLTHLENKILIDCTNPLTEDFSDLALGHSTSAAEKIAEWAKGAHVVKAFNMTGIASMANPQYGDLKSSLLICGNHVKANRIVLELGQELGFEAIDAGPLKTARYLEPLAMLWIHITHQAAWGSDIAFKILKREKKGT